MSRHKNCRSDLLCVSRQSSWGGLIQLLKRDHLPGYWQQLQRDRGRSRDQRPNKYNSTRLNTTILRGVVLLLRRVLISCLDMLAQRAENVNVIGLVKLQLDARRHRRGEGSLGDVLELDSLQESFDIGHQLDFGLVNLAHGDVHQGELGLGFDHGFTSGKLFGFFLGIWGDSTSFGGWHETLGTEDFGVFGQFGHESRRGNQNIKLDLAFVDILEEFIGDDGDALGGTGHERENQLDTSGSVFGHEI